MMSISILFSAVDRFYYVSENLDEADLGRDYVALWSTEKMQLMSVIFRAAESLLDFFHPKFQNERVTLKSR